MRLTTDVVAVARWGVFVFSLGMLGGDICVLPPHGNVEAAPTHSNGGHSPDESKHAAAFEALPSEGKASHAVFTMAPSVTSVPVEQPKGRVRLAGTPPLPTVSPPLFLLHAAFLI